MSFNSFSAVSSFGSLITRPRLSNISIVVSGQVSNQTYTDASGTYTQYYFQALSGTNYIQLNNIKTIQTLSILCIGGGGGGAYQGGGGGAGGFRQSSITLDPANFINERISVVVGAGGAGKAGVNPSIRNYSMVGDTGGNTTVSFQNNTTYNYLTSHGGGGGCGHLSGGNGASGGGSWESDPGIKETSYSADEYGNRGGTKPTGYYLAATGGGGAGGVGGNQVAGGSNNENSRGGGGGIGKRCSLGGISNLLFWAGGGGGMCNGSNTLTNIGGAGGGGGGHSLNGWSTGDRGADSSGNAGANTGGGGGGSGQYSTEGGNGGSGIVIISIRN